MSPQSVEYFCRRRLRPSRNRSRGGRNRFTPIRSVKAEPTGGRRASHGITPMLRPRNIDPTRRFSRRKSMNTRTVFVCAAVIVLLSALAAAQTPLGTAFTYQGQLKQNGSPASGSFNMGFTLWNDATLSAPANQVGVSISLSSVPVTSGIFTVQLDFPGGIFSASTV